MEKFQKQIAAFLKGLTTAQVLLLLVGVGVVGATVWGFVWMIGNSDYKPLYTGLAPADAQKLTQDLAAQNIAYRISADGSTVLVPSDELDKARLQAASQGPLASGRMGFELFDKPNWSGSDFSEKVNYQRALEAELERTIQTMNGVEQVRVHLVLPHESLFTERERPAKAAVVLKLRGMRMSDQTASSIANLVSSAWDDLSAQNVTVITTDGRMPNQTHGQLGDVENSAVDLETAMAERVVQVLAPVVGADHVKSSVTIEYDPTSAESTQDLYDPNSTAVVSSQTSQETAQDLDPSGIPGTATNAPNTPPAGAAASQSSSTQATQGIRSDNKTYAVSHTTKHLIEPAGRFKRIAAAVLVDDAITNADAGGQPSETRRKRSPQEMKQIEDLAKAALGFDATRGDQISVQNIAFQSAPIEQLEAPPLTERVRVVTERWTGMLRYVALFGLFLLVYFLILNPVKKQVLAAFEAAPAALPAGAANTPLAAAAPELAPGNRAGLTPGASTDPQLQRALNMRQQVVSTVKADPESAGRLVQNWLGESGAS
ncbi:MAG: flagellar basal-body MS-ring/collar protein FliF [Candidatus Acidiferrales bacterium]|jgi:flagellar M-ring protein FliF